MASGYRASGKRGVDGYRDSRVTAGAGVGVAEGVDALSPRFSVGGEVLELTPGECGRGVHQEVTLSSVAVDVFDCFVHHPARVHV